MAPRRPSAEPAAPNPHYVRIWRVVAAIPPGRVTSYGAIAARAGLPGRARLVGRALRECVAELPWHRVIGADGRIAFRVDTAQYKRQIARLRDEGIDVRRGRVRMSEYGWRESLDELLWKPDGWTGSPDR